MDKIQIKYNEIKKIIKIIFVWITLMIIGLVTSITLIVLFDRGLTYLSLLLFLIPTINFCLYYLKLMACNYKSFTLAYKIYIESDIRARDKVKDVSMLVILDEWDEEIYKLNNDKVQWFLSKFIIEPQGDKNEEEEK